MISQMDWELMRDKGAFADMVGSHGKHVTAKAEAAWYRQVQDCDLESVKSTFSRLAQADQFPKFKQFWEVYRTIENDGRPRARRWCGNCMDGQIRHWVKDEQTGENLEYIAFCGNCHPGHKNAISPHKEWIRWVMRPEEWNERKREQALDYRKQMEQFRSRFKGSADEAARQRNLVRYGHREES